MTGDRLTLIMSLEGVTNDIKVERQHSESSGETAWMRRLA